MTDLTWVQEKVLNIVKQASSGYPVTNKKLREGLSIKERSKEGADMRAVIHALRCKGYPICANTNGYYWPKDDHELSFFIAQFEARVRKEQKAIDGLNRAWDKVEKYKEPTYKERTRAMLFP